jgi:hypothetical protein
LSVSPFIRAGPSVVWPKRIKTRRSFELFSRNPKTRPALIAAKKFVDPEFIFVELVAVYA